MAKRTKLSKRDAESTAKVLTYAKDYEHNRGLKPTFPNIVARWDKRLEGWPVSDATNWAVVAFFDEKEAAEAAVVAARRAFTGGHWAAT